MTKKPKLSKKTRKRLLASTLTYLDIPYGKQIANKIINTENSRKRKRRHRR